ncbi:excisionase family DNA binding protein [Paenibacillus forsythiae]|uniref:Excisionase family DNA binding protein n=1 Tax=Paenibacillus forsythiae TaxID=365616 RepID=A0ABU3HGQ2_9BACL|nr:helix-turn-helix domain-containing protein [Paenibacillus forsythiae]MDT3429197.1 excisionase family DNA binding protein [Paenibacillus forsythiae]
MELLGKLYSIDEVSDMLKVDRKTVDRWIKENKLTAMKLAGTIWRIREKDLNYFILQALEEGRR